MTEPEQPKHDGRLDTMLPSVPLAAKATLLAGLAGGLFAAIVVSYVDNTLQYHALVAGILIGAIAALIVTVRTFRAHRPS
jgi:hypothetical protein